MQDVDQNFHSEYGDLWWRSFSNARRVLWWRGSDYYRAARAIVRYHARTYAESLHLAITQTIAGNPWIVGDA